MTKVVTLRLPDELVEEIDQIARDVRVDRTSVIRFAIERLSDNLRTDADLLPNLRARFTPRRPRDA